MKKEEEYKLLISQRQVEQNLLWTRHNFYLLFNTAILTGFAIFNKQEFSVSMIILTFIGMISSYLWVGVAKGGLKWINYYRDLLAEIENELKLEVKIFQKMQKKYEEFGTTKRLKYTIKGLPWFFFFIWIFLTLYQFYSLIFNN